MSGGARRVMTDILKQIDALDLYGSVAMPKVRSVLKRMQITHAS